MNLIVLSVCIFSIGFHATQALRCMQAIKFEAGNEKKHDEKTPEFTECGITDAAASAAQLLLYKPHTIAFPSTDYKCFHLRYEDTKLNTATTLKGCIYKNQDVCDGKYDSNSFREAFCSQCNQDECNSAARFASNWKFVSLTIFAVVCYFLK